MPGPVFVRVPWLGGVTMADAPQSASITNVPPLSIENSFPSFGWQ